MSNKQFYIQDDPLLESVKTVLSESSLSRVWGKTQKHVCGAISGYRGEDTRAVNQKKNKEILAYLMSKGYSVTSVKGSYIENKGSANEREVGEPSFFVCNHQVEGDDSGQLQRDLIALGRKYDQDSVIIIPVGGKGAFLYGTSKRADSFPGYGQKMKVGDGKYGKVSGEFLSRIRGREFAFEDLKYPTTINGIRAMKLLAEAAAEGLSDLDEQVKVKMIDGRARVMIPNKNTSAKEIQNIIKQLPKKSGRKWVFDTYGSEDGKNKYADFISMVEEAVTTNESASGAYEVDIEGYGFTTVKASTEKQAMHLALARLKVSPAARKGFNKSRIKIRLKK